MLRPAPESLLTIIYAQPNSFFCNLRLKKQSINMAARKKKYTLEERKMRSWTVVMREQKNSSYEKSTAWL